MPHILFLTGKLAEKSLHKVLAGMQPTEFSYAVQQIGINVAGLMTADLIARRVSDAMNADRIVVPGRCRGDLDQLAARYGVPVMRGPEELKDLPEFFGHAGKPVDLSRHDVLIFTEIVDAPHIDIAAILRRAATYRDDGADIIDLGCLPDTPFPHLEDAVRALHEAGHRVSVDSIDAQELLRGGRAGADYLLSLKEDTLWIADEAASVPVLIPSQPHDVESLARAIDYMEQRGRTYFADAILDPIHFGFTDSIVRYAELRKRFARAPIMMGIGNLTELTDADTGGVNALLMGLISELHITAVLTTEVSPHARSVVRETDAARRMMFAAREADSLPRNFSNDLLALHARKPFPDTPEEIAEIAAAIKDPSFRVQVSRNGIHVYNRDGLHCETDPFQLFTHLKLENDGAHAFYMGVELARAQIAFQLGKRYAQDQELDWGAASKRPADDVSGGYHTAGATLVARKPTDKS
ncbi:MAG: dihydropteroate synthase [Burkholderiales bacterium]|nr:dihydropteroate synthase [Burkholderiales bacterium]